MKIRWGEVFAYPFRSPWVLLQLWLLQWLPLLALIPLLFTGVLTMAGAALTTQHQFLKWPTLALGLSTLGAYGLFVMTAVFAGCYPMGYMLEVVQAVARGEAKPLPLGRWLPRALKGYYFLVICILSWIPVMLALGGFGVGLAILSERAHLGPAVPVAGFLLIAVVSLLLGFAALLYHGGVFLRLTRTLNPLDALNPIAILSDIGRGWLDYLVSHTIMFGLVLFLVACQFGVQFVAVFTGMGPFVLLPGLIIGLMGNYCVLAAAQASGQYVRHFVR